MKLPRHECGLYLEHNANRDYHQTVADYLEESTHYQFKDDASRAQCIAENQIWTLQWYPDTPIGSFSVAAATLDDLLSFASEHHG
jgi:hypothetical protein